MGARADVVDSGKAEGKHHGAKTKAKELLASPKTRQQTAELVAAALVEDMRIVEQGEEVKVVVG